MKVNQVWLILALSFGMGLLGGSVIPLITAILGEDQSVNVITIVFGIGFSLVLSTFISLLAAATVREQRISDLLQEKSRKMKPEEV